MKSADHSLHREHLQVAPVRERGLKCNHAIPRLKNLKGRSREGAWIEIKRLFTATADKIGRSREGAWIEIPVTGDQRIWSSGRSREGAWIEIPIILAMCLISYGSLP